MGGMEWWVFWFLLGLRWIELVSVGIDGEFQGSSCKTNANMFEAETVMKLLRGAEEGSSKERNSSANLALAAIY